MENVYIGIKGYAVCINKKTGDELWRTKLRSMTTLTTISHDNQYVFAYANGHLFCLDADTGKINWENTLPGLGHGHCIISTDQNQQQVSVADLSIQSSQSAGTN